MELHILLTSSIGALLFIARGSMRIGQLVERLNGHERRLERLEQVQDLRAATAGGDD